MKDREVHGTDSRIDDEAVVRDLRETARPLMETSADFRVAPRDARQIWDDVLTATDNWRDVAGANRVIAREFNDFAEALDHHRT